MPTHDIEHVHRLRVSTRRAVAALKLYRDWLPPAKFRWVKKRLKKIRRAAGDARDLDVLAERLQRELGERAAALLAEIERPARRGPAGDRRSCREMPARGSLRPQGRQAARRHSAAAQ